MDVTELVQIYIFVMFKDKKFVMSLENLILWAMVRTRTDQLFS